MPPKVRISTYLTIEDYTFLENLSDKYKRTKSELVAGIIEAYIELHADDIFMPESFGSERQMTKEEIELEAINQVRAERGAPPLTKLPVLTEAERFWAKVDGHEDDA